MSDVIQQAKVEVKKVEGEVKTEVAVAQVVFKHIGVAEFDALVARVEAIEKDVVRSIDNLESRIHVVFKHIGVDVKKFFSKL